MKNIQKLKDCIGPGHTGYMTIIRAVYCTFQLNSQCKQIYQ